MSGDVGYRWHVVNRSWGFGEMKGYEMAWLYFLVPARLGGPFNHVTLPKTNISPYQGSFEDDFSFPLRPAAAGVAKLAARDSQLKS